jgi:hypothetical protein
VGPQRLLPLTQLRRPLETLRLPRCYRSSAGSILRHSQNNRHSIKCSSRTLKPLGSFTTTDGRTLSNDTACKLLDDGLADGPATMLYISPYSILNLTGGLTPPLNTPTIYLLPATPASIPTYATIPAYSYSGHEAAATSSTQNTTTRPDVAWKQQPKKGVVLRSAITMPIKNFFLSSSLTPTHSSLFLRPAYTTGMSLNYQSQDPCIGPTSTSLNYTFPFSPRSSGMTLNCNLTQTSHDMPSSHVRHLGHLGHLRHLGHWTYCGMPSGPYVILGHLGHPGHLSHLGHLGNTGDLDPLDPSTLDPTPTDSLPGAFITEMDPTDPGPSQGCYADNSLDPLHTNSTRTVTQDSDSPWEYYTS